MNNMNSTASIVAIASVMLLSSLTVTPSIPCDYNYQPYYEKQSKSIKEHNTETLKAIEIVSSKKTFYDEAISLYDGEMRDFSPIELENYKQSIKKLYKPTGLNIFDLC